MGEIEDKMYVALGKDFKQSERTLLWALHNSGGRSICILHVHQPAQKIPFMGTKFLISQLQGQQVRAYHEIERCEMHKTLDKYIRTCEKTGAKVEKLLIESDVIEKGIVEFIHQNGIKKLVMGAAADKHFFSKMTELKSNKAKYVHLQAPASCHIWFICKGRLIFTRNVRVEERNIVSLSVEAIPLGESGPYTPLRSRSVLEGQNGQNSDYRTMSENQSMVQARPLSISEYESRYNHDGAPIVSPSPASRPSSASSSEVVDDLSLVTFAITDKPDKSVLALLSSSPPSVLQEGGMNDEMYDRIERGMVEAEKSKRDAHEESIGRRKAENQAIDAIRRAKASEVSYNEELRRRRETEKALVKGSQELEEMKEQLLQIKGKLQLALDQKSNLETEISNSDQRVHELEEKILSAVDMLQKFKKERDEVRLERDNAIKFAEKLISEQDEVSSSGGPPQFFNEFTFFEIEEATRNFDPDLKIDEGDYGSIYKGLIRHTQVTIKMLQSYSSQGPSEFQQEVNMLSKLRHPNLVSLIGACPECWTIIYEYLPNGTLEDRLVCKDNTPPLSWQIRIRILTELCSVLNFLQSSRPHGIIHGNIKPSSILLDANFVSRLTNFGIFCTDKELTVESDLYSFGIIVLTLLTGMDALGIVDEVEYALGKGTLNELLDPTAGNWPFIQAKQLAHLAISCCRKGRQIRPDFASEVWRVLEPMGVSCGASPFRLGSGDNSQIPHYYTCPIFQEVMKDPVVAADGYTYESEAIKGWLDSGHDTSPMTNLKLPNSNLLPNHALRSAIQESLHQ